MQLNIRQWAALWLIIFAIVPAHSAEVTPRNISTATNLPTITLQSSAPAKSLAMLLQVVTQLEHYVQTTNLSSIHNEDAILSAASSEMLTQASLVTADQAEAFKADLTVFCQTVSQLHLAADLAQQTRAETELRKVLAAFEKVKGYFSQQIIAAAQPSIDTFTCPLHRDIVGIKGDFCPKCGAKLDQFCRILPPNFGFPQAGQQTVRASVSTATPLTVGQPVNAILRLEKPNGIPVLLSDLIEMHTMKIHLLIVDKSLADYHHEHPLPTRNPGEYAFSFIPHEPGSYRVWADVRPYPLGLQEYARTDIAAPTAGKPFTDREIKLKTTVDGLNYELVLDQKTIQVGRPASAKLKITTPEGRGFTNLEPLMAAYAHIVGFNEDYKTVLHLHPKGEPVLDPAARGGPELEFIIYALRPGLVRIFAQVQFEGRSRFAPFGLRVAP
jgi:hypothetical protein